MALPEQVALLARSAKLLLNDRQAGEQGKAVATLSKGEILCLIQIARLMLVALRVARHRNWHLHVSFECRAAVLCS